MTGNHLYNLTWGEYGTSLVSAVQLLRCHGELVDVTLAAGGKTFSAHKVVLCAASPFLLDLLKSTTCKHPIVMLAGVQASDLEALLEFVYRGEVSIDQNQLPSLLQAAHCLNIQGLAPLNPEQLPRQTAVKTDIDISKSTNVEQIQTDLACHHQEGEIPAKRKKQTKNYSRSPSLGPQITKWPKVYVQLDNVINSTEHQEGTSEQQEGSQQNWTTHHMNLVSVPSATATEPIQTPILIQNISHNQNGAANSNPKVRGASDQPGTCPLCGAMLRQARNLRRHLLTSCKYRMVGNSQPHIATVEHGRTEESQLHNLQPISVQNLSRVNPNSAEHLESKQNLTPITCSELLTPTSNIIINMTANNL